ncbi:MAG: SHOCT domain-containing protein [Proteobacteria bacterium]|nr:SHOCT domain-containing protein [Pseudomonadota bacterium]MCP4915501.1 SHOCT domain-containing protein [Pseudomonadota bacterium]
MGVFDRIGNLGKGMIGIMKSGGSADQERADEALDDELEKLRAIKAKAQVKKARPAAAPKNEDALAQLKRLHASGLLTDEEYAAKVAAASGLMGASDEPDSAPDGDPPRVKKTL